jgi:hypothetical protein
MRSHEHSVKTRIEFIAIGVIPLTLRYAPTLPGHRPNH